MNIRRQLTSTIDSFESSYPLAAPTESPRSILEKIIWHKEREVALIASSAYREELERKVADAPPTLDFAGAIQRSASAVGLIAEVKKASPSKGVIRSDFVAGEIAEAYEKGGAACLSVLTDRLFFQGSFTALWEVRQRVALPILCKEFIISPDQVLMARAAGADAVLLIAAVLCDADLCSLFALARRLRMQLLVEVHTLPELDRVLSLLTPDLIGINNRNLEDFSVDLDNTRQLLAARGEKLKALGISVISESGIRLPADLTAVAKAGANGVLVGEALVSQPDVERAVRGLLEPSPQPSPRGS